MAEGKSKAEGKKSEVEGMRPFFASLYRTSDLRTQGKRESSRLDPSASPGSDRAMRLPKNYLLALLVFVSLTLPLRAETLVALTSDNKLHHFNSTAPNGWLKTIDITGLTAGDAAVAFDFKPDSSLFLVAKVGSSAMLQSYYVNPTTG